MTQELISNNKKTEYETIREMEAYLKQIEGEGEGEAQPPSTAPPDNREPESPQVLELTSGNKKTLLIPLEYVQLSMHQFREDIDWSHVDVLAEDIAMHGLEYPIVVYALGKNNYVVKDGEHRFHAVKKLGWKRIPAQVIIVDDGMQADLDAARLNLLRKEYDRKALFHVVQVFTSHGYSQNWIAKTFNLRKSKVNLYARLVRSDSDRLKQLREAFLHEQISEAHAEQLLRIIDFNYFDILLEEVLEGKWTTKKLQARINSFLEELQELDDKEKRFNKYNAFLNDSEQGLTTNEIQELLDFLKFYEQDVLEYLQQDHSMIEDFVHDFSSLEDTQKIIAFLKHLILEGLLELTSITTYFTNLKTKSLLSQHITSEKNDWENIWSEESQEKVDQKAKATHELQGGVKESVKCVRCGKLLTAKESVKLGIGPVCALMASRGDLGQIRKEDHETLEKVTEAYEYYHELGYYNIDDTEEKHVKDTLKQEQEKLFTFTLNADEARTLALFFHDLRGTSTNAKPEFITIATEIVKQYKSQGGVLE